MGKKQKNITTTISLPPEVHRLMDDLAEKVGATSKVEVIRRAIGVYDMIVRSYEQGYDIQQTKGDESNKIIFAELYLLRPK